LATGIILIEAKFSSSLGESRRSKSNIAGRRLPISRGGSKLITHHESNRHKASLGIVPLSESHRTISPWRVLLPVGLGTTLSLMGDTALYAVLPTHTANAGVAVVSVGLLLSANRWIRLLLNGPAGVAYDHWPRRSLFVPAMFVGAISTLLYAVTQGFWPLFIGRLLWGLAWSGIWVGGNTIILDVTTSADRGRWTGLYQLSFYLGGTLGFPMGGLLTDWLGYHQAFMVAASITGLGALIALLVLPETRGLQRSHALPTSSEAQSPPLAAADPAGELRLEFSGGSGAYGKSPLATLRSTRREALVSATALYGVNRFVVAGMISSTLGLLLMERWGAELSIGGAVVGIATLTGVALGLSTLISMLAAPLSGTWSDRWGSRWAVAAVGLLAGALGMGLLAVGLPALVVLGAALIAITSGSNQSLATAVVGDQAEALRRGRSLGWMHTVGDFSSALAPPLAYAVLPWIGLPGIYVGCTILLLAMLAWTLYLIPRDRAGRAAESLLGD
jgi:MFS family permease